jgi:hypothetical protein
MDGATVPELEPPNLAGPNHNPEVRTSGDAHAGSQPSQAETQTPLEPEASTEPDPTSAPASQRRHLVAWFLAPSITAVFLMGANVLWVNSIGTPQEIAARSRSGHLVSDHLETPRPQLPSGAAEKRAQTHVSIDPKASAPPEVDSPTPAISRLSRAERDTAATGAATLAEASGVPSPNHQLAVSPPAATPEARSSGKVETATRPEPQRSAKTRRRTGSAKAGRTKAKERPTQHEENRGWIVRKH